MDIISPLRSDYMKDVKLDELIREEREARLCDAKIKLGQYMTIQSALSNETLEEETRDLLLEKRRKKLQSLKNVAKHLSIQN